MAKARKSLAVFIGIRGRIADAIGATFDDTATFPRSAYYGARADFPGDDDAWTAHKVSKREETSAEVAATVAHVLSVVATHDVTVYVDTLSFGVREADGTYTLWPTIADPEDVRQFGGILRAMGATIVHGSF